MLMLPKQQQFFCLRGNIGTQARVVSFVFKGSDLWCEMSGVTWGHFLTVGFGVGALMHTGRPMAV